MKLIQAHFEPLSSSLLDRVGNSMPFHSSNCRLQKSIRRTLHFTLPHLRRTSSRLPRLPRLRAPQLRRRHILLLPLAQLDRRRTRNSLLTQIGAVALLGGRVDNGLVELAGRSGRGERRGLVAGRRLVDARGDFRAHLDLFRY